MQVDSNSCASAILPGGDPSFIVLGGNFMRRYFSVFRWSATNNTGMIGLADANMAHGAAQASSGAPASVAATRENRLSLLLDVSEDDDGSARPLADAGGPSSHREAGRRLLM